jgi:hypothetical protein
MKDIFKVALLPSLLIIVIVMTGWKGLYAQTHPFLGKFSAVEHNGFVQLNWTILAGNTCNGIQIYRSVDSLEFTQIGAIAGVCGNLSTPESYIFLDERPAINRINYYRLELGGSGSSQVIAIEIIRLTDAGVQIRPHPADANVSIYFSNSNNTAHDIRIYASSGTLMHAADTNQNVFNADVRNFPSGVYVLGIYNSDNLLVARGQLLVQH